MIVISKSEAEEVRKLLPRTGISIASRRKNSRGKTYYMEENRESMKLICRLRKIEYRERRYFY